jgi:hypothetical protein
MAKQPRPFKRAAEMEDKLWLALDEMVPPGVRTHLRSAAKEVLLAIRAMLDYAIARAETPARPERPRRIRVH